MDANVLALLQQMGVGSGGKGQPSVKALVDMIMSGKLGAITDTYQGGPQQVGYLPTPQVAMPTAYDYLNSQGPMGDIVQGLMSNDPAKHITPDAANRLLMSQINDSSSPLYGQDAAFLNGQLNKVMGEINDYSALQAKQQYAASQPDPNNPFTKAGLPTPDQRWSADSVPFQWDADLQDWQAHEANKVANNARTYGIQKNPDGSYNVDTTAYRTHVQPYAGKTMYQFDDQAMRALFDHLALTSGYGTTSAARNILKDQISKAYDFAMKQAKTKDGKITSDNLVPFAAAFNDYLHKGNGLTAKYLGKITPLMIQEKMHSYTDPEFKAYDYIDANKEHTVNNFKKSMQDLEAMNWAERGAKAMAAQQLNQSGMTPTMMGMLQRAAGVRQVTG